MENIIVIGPQASGKTLNAEAIAKAYGCSTIIDLGKESLPRKTYGFVTDALILARRKGDIMDKWRVHFSGRLVTIKQAATKCGDTWINPSKRSKYDD